LYAIEHEIRGLPVSERLAVRQMQSKPLLTSLYKLMQEKEHTLLAHSGFPEFFFEDHSFRV
ncbi:hypothetical protein H1A27_24045, partial [Escherichia coli]|nr:hypothetical protein [Escherichia coli]